jgi:hypothetical protein
MSNISIEIAVSCTYFQHRLCWMLSSILQQRGDPPHIVFNVAYPKNNGNPTTEEVCSFFRGQGLDMKETVYPDERAIQYRGLVRNRQLKETNATWLLFADADMTYDPMFFDDLGKKLEGELKDEKRVISASRISLAKEYCINYFDVANDKHKYPCVIEKAGELQDWPVFKISRNCGAGYFQLANVENIRKNHGGIYVDPAKCADRAEFDNIHKTSSDRQFRSLLGGLKKIKTLPLQHLNHIRDHEFGHHLTEQR